MYLHLSKEDRAKINELASRNSTRIPGTISLVAWPLPVLQAMLERIEKLEAEVQTLRGKTINYGG